MPFSGEHQDGSPAPSRQLPQGSDPLRHRGGPRVRVRVRRPQQRDKAAGGLLRAADVATAAGVAGAAVDGGRGGGGAEVARKGSRKRRRENGEQQREEDPIFTGEDTVVVLSTTHTSGTQTPTDRCNLGAQSAYTGTEIDYFSTDFSPIFDIFI